MREATTIVRHAASTALACFLVAAALTAGPGAEPRAAMDDDKRPRLSLKASPNVSISPSRVVLTAELTGGANDYEELYCATVSWDWGDGTESESTGDCQPYEAGKSEIKRRFTVQHVFRAGAHKVAFRLKRNDKTVAAAVVTVQVQPGFEEGR
ncbi:MAG: hypothetical protein ABUS56_00780 [Acidobacteriota bacterium]